MSVYLFRAAVIGWTVSGGCKAACCIVQTMLQVTGTVVLLLDMQSESPGRCKVLVAWAAMDRSDSLAVCLDDLLYVLRDEVSKII